MKWLIELNPLCGNLFSSSDNSVDKGVLLPFSIHNGMFSV